jgi:hypothetical protein
MQSPEELRQEKIAQLERELLLLRSDETVIDNNIGIHSNNPGTIISSPSNSLTTPGFIIDQQIAFVNSKQDVVPGKIISINRDETYDLEIYIPTPTPGLKWNKSRTGFERKQSYELIAHVRPKVRISDPRIRWQKQVTALGMAQSGGGDGISQTHINEYVPHGTVRIPRFHDFHTSIVGTFFDPSIYLYTIHCWRPEYDIQGQKFPAETKQYPKNSSYFDTFSKAFARYFKEYYKGMSKSGNKWNSVQIQIHLKEDLVGV